MHPILMCCVGTLSFRFLVSTSCVRAGTEARNPRPFFHYLAKLFFIVVLLASHDNDIEIVSEKRDLEVSLCSASFTPMPWSWQCKSMMSMYQYTVTAPPQSWGSAMRTHQPGA